MGAWEADERQREGMETVRRLTAVEQRHAVLVGVLRRDSRFIEFVLDQ